MRIYARLPGPFAVGFNAPTLEDLDYLRDAKIAEYYHQYCAYYNAYMEAEDAGQHVRARRMYRKCQKYAKKLGPYVPSDNPQWTFE